MSAFSIYGYDLEIRTTCFFLIFPLPSTYCRPHKKVIYEILGQVFNPVAEIINDKKSL